MLFTPNALREASFPMKVMNPSFVIDVLNIQILWEVKYVGP